MEVVLEALSVAAHYLREVTNLFLFGEEAAEHGANLIRSKWNASLVGALLKTF